MKKYLQRFLLLTLSIISLNSSSIQAQTNDGDWLLFEENYYWCFFSGECTYGYFDFYGQVENDSCTNLGYTIDFIMTFAGTNDTILKKLNVTEPGFGTEVPQGFYDIYIIGTNACGIQAIDTSYAELMTCGPPYALPAISKSYRIDSNEVLCLNAIDDFYDDYNGMDCLFSGYIDSLKVKIDDSLQIATNLADTLCFSMVDTGYLQVQLWEKSQSTWSYSGTTWIHLYAPYNNTVSGKIYYDQNENCHFDDGEIGLNMRQVYYSTIQNLATPDSLGSYVLPYNVPLNPFETRNVGIYPFIPTGCQPDSTLSNSALDQGDIEIDWGVQLKPDCSELQVDISAPFLRRCFSSIYYVNYCNIGTEQADSAYIEILIDPFLVVTSSTFPWANQNGQLFTFFLGDVEGGECGTFKITVEVGCEGVELGQLHCSEAHIYPNETCIDTTGLWGGGNIEMTAFCETDSVRIKIQNTGLSPTSDALEYFIVEDDIIIFFNTFDPLGPGESITIGLPKNGSFYYAQSEQEPFHPIGASPSAFVEGCVFGTDTVSIGYAGQFPINDAEPFLDIDCTENIGSFDPNDKSALPIGFTDAHFVELGDKLEYMIRFQNTGTDTAFNIRIIDTLSEHFLIGTFNPLVASHPYTFNITPEGIATFNFENIALPDSNVNLINSNGFIKFEIQLRNELSAGTLISNEASIYFDFNEPIITNLVNHRIEPNFVQEIYNQTSTIEPKPAPIYNYWTAKIFPNPVREISTIQISHPTDVGIVDVSIINSIGQEIQELQTNESGTVILNLKALSTGVYFIQVKKNELVLTSEKFVKL